MTWYLTGPHGEVPGPVRKQKEPGGDGGNFIVVAEKRQEQGRVSRLLGLGHFGGLWDIGAGPGCLVPGPEASRAGEQWSRVREPSGRGNYRV